MTIISGGQTQPGSAQGVVVEKRIMTSTSAAGVTTSAPIYVPAGAYLIDVYLYAVALWPSTTSATAIVGDVNDPNGFFAAVDLKATDLLAGEALSLSEAGGKAGAYVAANQVLKRYFATAEQITCEITTVGTTASGETHLVVIYTAPQHVGTQTYVAT